MTVYQCARGVHGLGWLVSTARCLALSWGWGRTYLRHFGPFIWGLMVMSAEGPLPGASLCDLGFLTTWVPQCEWVCVGVSGGHGTSPGNSEPYSPPLCGVHGVVTAPMGCKGRNLDPITQ